MLTVTKLRDADYLINQVAVGLDHYYLGRGEAPGVWHGAWAKELGLEAMVDHDHLRSLLEGRHPVTCAGLLAGRPMREVAAFDATFSAPKSGARAARLVNHAPYLLDNATMVAAVGHHLREDPRSWRDALDRSVEVTEAARPTPEMEGPSLGLGL